MLKTLIKPSLFSNKKTKNKPDMNNTKTKLPPNLKSIEQKLTWGNGFVIYEEYFSTHQMSCKNFELLDKEPIDKFFIKRDFLKVYTNRKLI